MTDDDKAIAQAIHGILREAYLHVPWTLDQTFSDMCRKDTVYYLASDDQNQVVGFLATTSVMPIALLKRFRAVVLEDSSVLALPEELAAVWPGCGNQVQE